MIKIREPGGTASVTFTVDPRVDARTAAVCGEWNGWSPTADVMRHGADGGFSVTVELEVGRAYRFRYLLDGVRWENDWAADAYLPNSYGEDDSVVDLTALATAPPSAAKKTPAKKAPAKRDAAKTTTKAAAAKTTKKAAAEPAGKTTKKTRKTK
jgi:1,4-alpha-glucan branching enzyme